MGAIKLYFEADDSRYLLANVCNYITLYTAYATIDKMDGHSGFRALVIGDSPSYLYM
jgi:hypothetical protein